MGLSCRDIKRISFPQICGFVFHCHNHTARQDKTEFVKYVVGTGVRGSVKNIHLDGLKLPVCVSKCVVDYSIMVVKDFCTILLNSAGNVSKLKLHTEREVIMKKAKIVTATLAMALACAACSGGTSNAPAANSQAPEDFKPITLRYANQHSIDHTATLAAQAAAEEIHEKTDGRITIEVYPANQLGDWTQVYEEVMMGTIDIANTTVPETYDARANASMLPYLANSYAELDKAMGPDSYLAGKMVDIQAAQGIKFLGYSCEGFAGIGTSKPVPNPNEVGVDKGILVRVPSNDNFKYPTEYMGYRTSTIPYSDTFAAIQTGVVDGWQAGPPNLNYLNFRDVITYYYHYCMDQEATQIYMNMDVFNSLLPQDQKVLQDAFRKMWTDSINSIEEEDAKYIQMLKDYGIEVIEFTDEELAAFADGVRADVWPKLAETYTQEFLDELLDSVQ